MVAAEYCCPRQKSALAKCPYGLLRLHFSTSLLLDKIVEESLSSQRVSQLTKHLTAVKKRVATMATKVLLLIPPYYLFPWHVFWHVLSFSRAPYQISDSQEMDKLKL